MSRKQKFLILSLSFLFLGWFVFQPMVRLGVDKPYLNPPVSGQTINAAELSAFLDLWSRVQQSELKKYIGQMSLSAKNEYPRPLVKWLEAQNWSVERFFYDEQRLYELARCAKLKISLEGHKALAAHNNLRDIIRQQQRQMKACSFGADEMTLIEANLYPITEIFAGRAILEKGLKEEN